MLLQLRPSNEALRRARVPGAMELRGCPVAHSSSLCSSLVLEGVAKVALDCAHRTRAFPGRAFCEQGGHLATPSRSLLTLASASSTPVQYPRNPLAL